MEIGGGSVSRKKIKFISNPSASKSNSKEAIKDEDIEKLIASDNSDVECLDSEANRDRETRNKSLSKPKVVNTKMEMERQMDEKLTSMGVTGISDIPFEEKKEILSVMELSQKTAVSHESRHCSENEDVTIDDDDDDFVLSTKKAPPKKNSGFRVLKVMEATKKVCETNEDSMNEISRLRKRGIVVSEITENKELSSDDLVVKPLARKTLNSSNSRGLSAELEIQDVSESFHPNYPKDKPMEFPKSRIEKQKEILKKQLHYIPDDVIGEAACQLYLQKKFDEHDSILMKYRMSKIASDTSQSREWVTIPCMNEHQNRIFYKNLQAKSLPVSQKNEINDQEDILTENELQNSNTSKSEILSEAKSDVSGNCAKTRSRLVKKASPPEKENNGWMSKFTNVVETKSKLSRRKVFFDGKSQLASTPCRELSVPESDRLIVTESVNLDEDDDQNEVPAAKKRKNKVDPENCKRGSDLDEDCLSIDVLTISEKSKAENELKM